MNPAINKCKQCGKETTNPKFCSLSCSVIFNNKLRPKFEKVKNICLKCGEETTNLKFCSRSCSASYNNIGVRRHGKAPKPCLNCGKKTTSWNAKYCSNRCQFEYQHKEYIRRWKNGEEAGMKGNGISNYIKRYLLEKYDNKCSNCEWNEVNPVTKKVPLEVEHIDGDWKNNKEENLDLLCPNCHSLTPTYRALNVGNGRTNRRIRYKEGKSY